VRGKLGVIKSLECREKRGSGPQGGVGLKQIADDVPGDRSELIDPHHPVPGSTGMTLRTSNGEQKSFMHSILPDYDTK